MNMLEKQYQKMYHKILTDDTRWDLMTAKELEKRIAKFKADEKSQDKMLSMLSCLRLAEILYLYCFASLVERKVLYHSSISR